MPSPRPLSSWDDALVQILLGALVEEQKIECSSPSDAFALRRTLYEVRESMRREEKYDGRVDHLRLRAAGRTLHVELKRNARALGLI